MLLTAEAVGQDAIPQQVSAHAPMAQDTATLPKDTEVATIILETVSSATARKGQVVRLAVAKDIMIDGRIVIPKGTSATGVIARLQKGILGTRDGYLDVRPVAVTLAEGTRVKLKEYPTGQDSCGDLGPCWAFPLFVVAISPFVIAALPVAAVVALFHPDRDKGKTTYKMEKPVGKDWTLAACSQLGMKSFVAHPVNLRASEPVGSTPNSGLAQCPNLAFPN